MEVKGDLIIADAVGDGDVTLENVRVDGRLIIRGGGEHSIHIAGDASRYGTVIVTKTASGKVRLVNESGAPIPMVNVADGRDGVTLEGDFTGVVVGTVPGFAPRMGWTNLASAAMTSTCVSSLRQLLSTERMAASEMVREGISCAHIHHRKLYIL